MSIHSYKQLHRPVTLLVPITYTSIKNGDVSMCTLEEIVKLSSRLGRSLRTGIVCRFSRKAHYSDGCVTDESKSVKRVTSHSNFSRMANALHRSQTRLWRARNQTLLTAVVGTRWKSNLKSQSSLSDIEVLFILSPHIVLMSVPEHSMEG